MLIPIYSFAEPDMEVLKHALTEHGLVIVDVMRTQAGPLGEALGRTVVGEPSSDDGPYVLHISCAVDPVMEHGWVDFYIYSPVYDGTPREATELVGTAVRQWGEQGKPEAFMAKLGCEMPVRNGWCYRQGRWELWWRQRAVAIVRQQPGGAAQIELNAFQGRPVKQVNAASLDQAKRYAERWCAVRLLPTTSLKVGASMLGNSSRLAES